MSIKVMDRVFGLPLKTVPKFILMAIADYADEVTGECWPKVSTIAAKSAQSERNVQKWLSMFEAWGLIEREARQAYGRQSSNRIRMNVRMTAEQLIVRIKAYDAARAAQDTNHSSHYEQAVYVHAVEPEPETRGDSESPQTADGIVENAPGVTRGVIQESPHEPLDKPSTPLPPSEAEPEPDVPTFEQFASAFPDVNAFGDQIARSEFGALSAGLRRRAVEACEPYRQSLGKQRTVTARHFLRTRMFDSPTLKPKPVRGPDVFVAEGGEQWDAWAVLYRICDSRTLSPISVHDGKQGRWFPAEWPAMERGLPVPPRTWREGVKPEGWVIVKAHTQQWFAWQDWLERTVKPGGWNGKPPFDRVLGGWCFPSEWPPRKDGTFLSRPIAAADEENFTGGEAN